MIKVGAATEVELKEKKHRVEDALSATRAAVEEGIVPGGGVAFINALPKLDKVKARGRQGHRRQILRRALEEPLRRIAENAGKEGSVVVDKEVPPQRPGLRRRQGRVRRHGQGGHHRPAKVTRSALENAVSIAGHGAHHRGADHRHPREEGGTGRSADAGVLIGN